MEKLKLFKSINTLPIWNLTQIELTGDYRFLYSVEDGEDLPKKTPEEIQELKTTFEKIASQRKDVDLSFLNLKAACWYYLLNFLTQKNDEQKVHTSFSQYRKRLGENTKNFKITENTILLLSSIFEPEIIEPIKEIKDKVFKDLESFYKTFKNYFEYHDLMKVRLYIIEFAECEFKKDYDLYKESVNIELALNVNIDIYTCPAAKYFRYRDIVIKRNKEYENSNILKKKVL